MPKYQPCNEYNCLISNMSCVMGTTAYVTAMSNMSCVIGTIILCQNMSFVSLLWVQLSYVFYELCNGFDDLKS